MYWKTKGKCRMAQITKDRDFRDEIRKGGVALRHPRKCRVLLGILAIGQFTGMLLMIERPAHAYVDPGSGLLTLQMLGASVAGGLFFLRHKLRTLLGGRPDEANRAKEAVPSRQSTDGELATPRSSREVYK
jgi:hypothetical protein